MIDMSNYICRKSESILSVIEKCLDNGVNACLIVEDDQRLLGWVLLDDIRPAIMNGTAAECITVEALGKLHNDITNDILKPLVDEQGRLTEIIIDRSKQFVQVAKPHMSKQDFRSLLDAFMSGWISSKGTYVTQLESEFARFIGIKHGVAVSNGTVALHLALEALGIKAGDEVIVPDLTFAATINAVLYCGATPIVVDIDKDTWCLTRALVEAATTARTKAIIPVHLYGRPAEIGPICEFARQRGIAVVEDCAEAHGARYDGQVVGSFGDVACFSFYGNKIITTGEGGMCLTNDSALDRSLRVLRDHGMTPDKAYWHERVGFNYRMTNLASAIGTAQLGRIAETLQRNAHIQSLYQQVLGGIPGVSFPPVMPEVYQPVTWLACAQVPADRRMQLMQVAKEAGIETRPFFYPLSCLPPYGNYARSNPNARELSLTGLNLPTSLDVNEEVVGRVAQVFHKVLS